MEKLAEINRYFLGEGYQKTAFARAGAVGAPLLQVFFSTYREELQQESDFVPAGQGEETPFKGISIDLYRGIIGPLLATVALHQDKIKKLEAKISSIEESTIKKVEISSLGDEKLELRRNIPVHLEADEDEVIAKFVDAEVTGFGESEYEALDSLKDNMVSLYYELIEDETNLGPIPRRWLTVLKEIIKAK